MSGMAGCWGGNRSGTAIGEWMTHRIENRDPDHGGDGLTLAHRRLAILDLSPVGHQPMHSSCGQYVRVFSGEIGNRPDLRAVLEIGGGAFKWQGRSDTEILLADLRHWEVGQCLQKLNGMFAFAPWDTSAHTLFLARNRMDEKPFYYECNGDTFLFGSELKTLATHPNWCCEVGRDASPVSAAGTNYHLWNVLMFQTWPQQQKVAC